MPFHACHPIYFAGNWLLALLHHVSLIYQLEMLRFAPHSLRVSSQLGLIHQTLEGCLQWRRRWPGFLTRPVKVLHSCRRHRHGWSREQRPIRSSSHSSDKLQRVQQEEVYWGNTWASTPAAINRPPANLWALWVTDCSDRSWEITGRRKHLCHSMSVSVLSHAIDLKLMPHGWRLRNRDGSVIFSHSKASFISHWFILHSKRTLGKIAPKGGSIKGGIKACWRPGTV